LPAFVTVRPLVKTAHCLGHPDPDPGSAKGPRVSRFGTRPAFLEKILAGFRGVLSGPRALAAAQTGLKSSDRQLPLAILRSRYAIESLARSSMLDYVSI